VQIVAAVAGMNSRKTRRTILLAAVFLASVLLFARACRRDFMEQTNPDVTKKMATLKKPLSGATHKTNGSEASLSE
jgi:hypothetical protein